MRAQRRNGGLKTNIWKRTLAGILLTALTVTALPSMALSTPTRAEAASAILKNPRIVKDDSMDSGQKVTWDCIWFGSYPQREIVEDADTYAAIDESYYNPQTDIIEDASLFQKLENTSGWNDNEIILDGEKYRRMKKGDALCSSVKERNFYHWNDSISWHYFKYEPIKWRVLNVKGNSAFIQTDVAIDDQEYSAYGSNSAECFTWNMSNIRSWLNGYSTEQNQIQKDYCNDNFLEDAFNYIQVKAIQLTEIGKDSGENEKKVIDKIFLLSDQITFANYGFRNNYANDEARLRKSSTYAKARGVKSSISSKAKYVGNCCWWGHAMKYPKQVNGNGEVSVGHMYFDMCGVVPALNFDVSNTNLWSYAGTVCSDGTVNEQAPSGSGGNSGETPDTGGNSGETEEADKNRKLYLDVSSLSGKFFRKGQTKSLPFYFYAETEEKLKELIGSLSWTDKKTILPLNRVLLSWQMLRKILDSWKKCWFGKHMVKLMLRQIKQVKLLL